MLTAVALALVYHGALAFYTFTRTYDAFVHIFFADHYARAWFDPWEYRWYTGFTMTSYPPGSQQCIALISQFVGLLNGFVIVQTFSVVMVVVGMYRFSRIWVSEEAAGYAALLIVFSSSITETMHVFGQLPTMFSLGFLLNALPYVYRWLKEGDWKVLLTAWALNAATTAGHHVTTLFGALFFVGPVIALAIVEKFRQPLPDESTVHPANVSRRNLRPLIMRRLRRIVPVTMRAGVYGVGLIVILVMVVLPYWLWSRSDPITQVPIPHASRDSFIENPNAGLVFWLIPYGVSLAILPYVFYKGLSTRAWPMTLSIGLLFLLGTGGTTPLPRLLLRGAFEILTLDRFTFWATILIVPLLGEFVVSLRHGRLARYTREQFGDVFWRLVQVGLVLSYLFVSVFTANLTQFRRFQPQPIDTQPILNFIEKDEHWRWRYLTLGFGDQMAWLAAQTEATTVDGNYHSARRLPELTTTPVERLEGAKFRGIPGIGSLQQFLAVPEKYNLKFVFSNDEFYTPLLFFSGWHQLGRLENAIMVWEREDVPPLPEVLPRREIPMFQRALWGFLPMSAIAAAFVVMSAPFWGPSVRKLVHALGVMSALERLPWLHGHTPVHRVWEWIDRRMLQWSQIAEDGDSDATPWQVWLNWLRRLPRPRPVAPTARQVRSAILIVTGLVAVAFVATRYTQMSHTPTAVVEAYYDDLDFRRFGDAHARLDPMTRPSYEQYRLDLSVKGGLVASYGKLDSVRVQVLRAEPKRVEVRADTVWVTALAEFPSSQRHMLVERDGRWYITPETTDVTVPPDAFLRRAAVEWHAQGRRRVTEKTTDFGDVLDRPELQVLSARLVEVNGRHSVVGELINTDADPADVTVTAVLYNEEGEVLTSYNAQTVMMHKILPKEVTPFRVDFEGVAGAVVNDTQTAGDFKADAYSPVALADPVVAFDVYAKAVVTARDLYRDVTAQDLHVEIDSDGVPHLTGQILNSGTLEATVPHLLITYYDAENRVAWVDHAYLENSVRPQRARSFSVRLTRAEEVVGMLDKGELFSNILKSQVSVDSAWRERIAVPPGLGYAALRVSVHYFTNLGL